MKKFILASAILATFGSHASAANRYWDPDLTPAGNNATTGAGLGGNGTWDTSALQWWDGVSADVAWNNSNNDDLIISNQKTAGGADTHTVTIASGAMTANSITFDQKTTVAAARSYTITGGTGITLTTGNITVPTGNNGNGNINTPITTAGNLTLISNNTTANNQGVGLGAAGNSIGGDIYLTGGGVPTTSAWALKLNLNAANAVPSTADFYFDRNQSQVNFNAAVNFGTVSNNFFLNNLNAGTFEGSIGVLAGATVTLSGVVSGNSDLRFGLGLSGGAGIVTLTNNSTYTGNTRFLHAQTGVVKLGVNDALPTTTGLSFGTGATNAGSLDLNGFNQTVTSLASPVTTGIVNGITNTQGSTTSTLTIKGSDTATYVGNIGVATNISNLAGSSDNIALVLDAANTGVQTLSRPAGNTYTGGTTINGGTLLVTNTSGSGTGSGNVTVGAGGTLGGTGSVAGNVLSSGTLSPGTSVGTLTIDGTPTPSLSLLAGSYKYEINSTTVAADLTMVRGNLNITAGTALAASDLGGTLLTLGTKLTLINYGGTWNGGLFNGLADDSQFFIGVNMFRINYNDTSAGANGGSFGTVGQPHWVTITAVPEASSFVAFGLCGIMAIAAVRMGKRFGFSLLKI